MYYVSDSVKVIPPTQDTNKNRRPDMLSLSSTRAVSFIENNLEELKETRRNDGPIQTRSQDVLLVNSL